MQIIGTFVPSVMRALSEIDERWMDYPGLVVCGSHGPYDHVEESLALIKEYREKGLPIYGECFGHQLAHIEWARNVEGIKDATSEEWSKKGTLIVIKRKALKVGLHDGESWWSNYEVVKKYKFPKNYFLSPAHPSYQSYKGHEHPLLKSFVSYAKSR